MYIQKDTLEAIQNLADQLFLELEENDLLSVEDKNGELISSKLINLRDHPPQDWTDEHEALVSAIELIEEK